MTSNWTDRSRSARIPTAVWVLAAGIVALGTSEFGIAGLLPEISADLAVSIPDAGLLVSAFAVGMAVGAPVLAVGTLRLPRRLTLVVALGVFVAGQVLGAMATGYSVLLASRVLTAVATGAFWAVAAVVTVSLVEPGIRARALALLVGGLTVSNVFGVPLGTALGQQLGWRSTFWAVALLGVVAVVGVLSTVPRDAGGERAKSSGLRAELRTFRSGRLWLALATTALFQAGVMGSFSYLAPLLTDVAALPVGAVPVVLAVFGVGSLVGVWLGGRHADARPWRTLIGALAASVAALAGLALLAPSGVIVVALVFATGVAAFTAAGPLNGRVFALAGSAPTLASATNVSAFNVGNTVGPWAGGAVIAAGFGFTAPAVLGAMSIAAALLLGLLSRRWDQVAGRSTPAPASPPRDGARRADYQEAGA